ncbi:MAG: glycosyltransferase [Candidatus Gastranaerophilales bacterium]|nr:glycosyltransferase [Candidatus Gastranaerophilales bacterium]
MPKVSVLIPIYNSEKYLRECIKSVTNQSLKEIEIILINDGSFDSSLEIIEYFKNLDDRIKVINKENTGYANSLNIGVKEAKGEYISIVESDDIIVPDMLKTLYNKAIKSDYDIVKSSFYLMNKNKYIKYDAFKNIYTHIPHNVITTPEILTIKPSVWSAIYKKEFLTENNLQFHETHGASFQDISFQFIAFYIAKKILFVDMPLYLYRIDNANSSINSSDKVFEICSEFYRINDFLKNNFINMQIENQKILFEFKAYLWNLNRIKDKYREGFLDKISDTISQYDLNEFFTDKNISKKDKFKLKLLVKNKKLFFLLFKLSKLLGNKKNL